MSSNPYAPPTTRVADIESVPDSVSRPVQVKIAVALLWLTLGAGLSRSAIILKSLHMQGSVLLGVAIGLCVFVPLVGLWTYRISRGGRWARLTYALMVAVGLVGYVAGFVKSPPAMQPNSLLLAVQTVLQTTAIILLFTPSANRWFRRHRSAG